MLLQTDPGGWQLGLLVLVLAGVGLVSYWVYRDAAARGMEDAPYWGAAVGVAAVIGVIAGGIVAVGVYLSVRPDEYAGGERPFDALWGDDAPARDEATTDRAHADLPPVPELTAERVADASETTLRGYARRYDRLDATGDPEGIRAALLELVEADETDRLGKTLEEVEAERSEHAGVGDAGDHRRHLGRPRLRSDRSAGEATDDGGTAGAEGTTAAGETTDAGTDTAGERGSAPATQPTAESDGSDDRGFEWVEES